MVEVASGLSHFRCFVMASLEGVAAVFSPMGVTLAAANLLFEVPAWRRHI